MNREDIEIRTWPPGAGGASKAVIALHVPTGAAAVVNEDTTPRERVIRQRVLGHYQHEALESLLIAGQRVFDPHAAHWYSNLVADWRFNS